MVSYMISHRESRHVVVWCHTLPYPTPPRPTPPYPTLPYPTVPYPTMPRNAIPYLTIPYQTPYQTPYHTIPCHTIPYSVGRRYDNMSLCTDSRVHGNVSWVGNQFRTGNPRISKTICATRCIGQRANDSVVTRPSKTDWHQPNGITHALQQGRFSMGWLYLALPYKTMFPFYKNINIYIYIYSETCL